MGRIFACIMVLILSVVTCLSGCGKASDAEEYGLAHATIIDEKEDVSEWLDDLWQEQTEFQGEDSEMPPTEETDTSPTTGKNGKDGATNSGTSNGNKTTGKSASPAGSGKSSGTGKTSTSSGKKTSGKTSSGSNVGGNVSSPQETSPGGQETVPGNGTEAGNGGNETPPSVNPEPSTPADKMNWPSNEYTSLLPRPSSGVVKKTDMQDGVYCLLLTGADMTDAKSYAASLINYGYANDVTETVESGTYLFGGGNAGGSFVVVSYQNGQFIIGIQP